MTSGAGTALDAEPRAPLGGLGARWGLPALAGRRRLVFAVVVDTLGVGLLFPITLLYFTLTTNIPVSRLGVLLSASMIVSLPFGPVGGELAHRLGAGRLMIINNLVSALGYLGFLFADRSALVFASTFLVAVADRFFWSCWSPYLRSAVGPDSFETWFAFLESVKAACLGIGAGLAALFLAVGGRGALHVLVAVNIATCLLAAAALARQGIGSRERTPAPDEAGQAAGDAPASGWLEILRDRRYLLLSLGQFLVTPVGLLSAVAFPVFWVHDWRMPSWTVSALFTLGCLLTFVFQSPITRLVRGVHRATVMLASGLLSCLAMAIVLAADALGRPGPALGTALAALTVIVLGTAGMLYFPSSNAALLATTTEENAGRVTSVFHFGTSLGMAFSPALMSWLLSRPWTLWALMAALAVAGNLCFAKVIRSWTR